MPGSVNVYNGYLIYSDSNAYRTYAMDLTTRKTRKISDQSYQFVAVAADRLFTDKGAVALDALR